MIVWESINILWKLEVRRKVTIATNEFFKHKAMVESCHGGPIKASVNVVAQCKIDCIIHQFELDPLFQTLLDTEFDAVQFLCQNSQGFGCHLTGKGYMIFNDILITRNYPTYLYATDVVRFTRP